MMPKPQGSFRLFQAGGITVFLHWSWFLVAAYEFNARADRYDSRGWNVVEYLALFAMVLMHEFGHSLACRQVGGQASQIVLWPLGGVAYVAPPQRPGATLWSIVAGPLVNVVLFVVLTALEVIVLTAGLAETTSDAIRCLDEIWKMNLGLLVFNLLPIYPLDGGQILRSLLWYFVGPAKSLVATTVIGLLGVGLLLTLVVFGLVMSGAAVSGAILWLGVLCAFILMNCWRGLQTALVMLKLERRPRRLGFACPICRMAPQMGAFWGCGRCRTAFDTFETLATCPTCAAQFAQTRCLNCGGESPLSEWLVPAPVMATLAPISPDSPQSGP
ncbi:MAG: M50 family metallopeptidase [Planctomycetota bacterium]|nr:M50 family metallopeptidase [Planctomycetota bacterium]